MLPAKLGLLDAVDLANADGHLFVLNFLCKLFPCRVEALAPNTPRSIQVDEGHLMLVEKALKVLLGQLNGVNAILVQLFQGFLVLLVNDRPHIAIAAGKDPPLPGFVELPLLNVLGDVLPIGPQRIPNIDRHIIAMQVQQRYIEIEPYLCLSVVI